MTYYTETFSTPLGPFSTAVDDRGTLVGTAFGDRAYLQTILGECHLVDDSLPGRAVREQVLAYFTGERRDFSLPLGARGSAFQQRVWAALRAIPFGETRSYGELADTLGKPGGARAVGRANATNPICLIVPCHRVIGADGSLAGFAFGPEIKRWLLTHEGALAPTLV
jgi:methylated-DNA-[protein]-cysteine S-methyltransferase